MVSEPNFDLGIKQTSLASKEDSHVHTIIRSHTRLSAAFRVGLDSAFAESCVHVFPFSFLFFFFFFHFHVFKERQILLFRYNFHCSCTVSLLFTYCSSTVHAFKNIKNGSHSTIYTFKNYFITVFLVFNFQFQQK